MKNTLLALKILVICFIGLAAQMILHEYGHVVLALLTGNTIAEVNFATLSYVTVNIVNKWSIPIVSLGSFILPIVVCLLLGLLKNNMVNILVTSILTITIVQLLINAIAILVVDDTAVLQTYDLGVFITSMSINNVLVSIVVFAILIILGICLTNKLKKVVDAI